MRDMSHTSSQSLTFLSIVAKIKEAPSVHKPVTEASQLRNANDHKLARLDRPLHSNRAHPGQSINWYFDKIFPTQSTGDCLPVLPSLKLPKYDLDFPQIEGHLDWFFSP